MRRIAATVRAPPRSRSSDTKMMTPAASKPSTAGTTSHKRQPSAGSPVASGVACAACASAWVVAAGSVPGVIDGRIAAPGWLRYRLPVTDGKDVSNADILTELRELRALVDGLLHDFGPALAVFRPQNGAGRINYVEAAGAWRAARKRARADQAALAAYGEGPDDGR